MTSFVFSDDSNLNYLPEGPIFGPWRLNDDMTKKIRESIDSTVIEELPVDKDGLEMVRKQEFAREKLQLFIGLSNDHDGILNEFFNIMTVYLDYLDGNSMKQLIDKIVQISQSDHVDFGGIDYFNIFIEYIGKRMQGIRLDDETEELFDAVVEQFQEKFITSSLSNRQVSTKA